MQVENRTPAAFLDRTDALAKKLRIALRELHGKIGISRATLFNSRSDGALISDKTWDKLEQAEVRAGLAYPKAGTKIDPRVSEENRGAAGAAPFREYLDFIRSCREEAERIGAGDQQKTIDVFDRLLSLYERTLSKVEPADHDAALQELAEDERRRRDA